MDQSLVDLRHAIETVDDELVSLLVRRMRLSVRIATIKRRNTRPIYDSAREKDVLHRVRKLSQAPMTHDEIDRIYVEVMKVSRAVQKRTMIANKEIK
ncbi:chorismate mutase [bacterium]|nr:chorismate mutase [bacterium]